VERFQFIALADRINRAMPEHVVTVLTEALDEHGRAVRGASILVLGVTYIPDVNDIRESTALEIIEMLARKGARVNHADPFVPQLTLDSSSSPPSSRPGSPGGSRLRPHPHQPLALRLHLRRLPRPALRGHAKRHEGVPRPGAVHRDVVAGSPDTR